MKNATLLNVRAGSAAMTLLLALGVVCVGDIGTTRGESIPVDSSRWQLAGNAKVDDYLGGAASSLKAAAPR